MSLVRCTERRLLVDLLVILFGISAWVEINGLWVELPLLVQSQLPEGWKLGSYIVVITQIANIGPITFTIIKKHYPGKEFERRVIHCTLFVGTLSCLLLSMFWDRTLHVGSGEHSLALLVLTTCLALVDCTSSVLYMPFLSYYKGKYLMSYLIGEGLSGLLPSMIALTQGVGGSPECVNATTGNGNFTLYPKYPAPRFSVQAFFLTSFGIMVLSWIAFLLMNVLPAVKTEKLWETSFQGIRKSMYAVQDRNGSLAAESKFKEIVLTASCENSENNLLESVRQVVTKYEFYKLLGIQAFVCCLTNGVLPSIQTYSTLPYGDLAHHLAISLSLMANPLACFVAMFLKCEKVLTIAFITFLGTLCSCFIMAAAVMSPSPPLVHTVHGIILVILIWIALVGLFSYAKACVAGILREQGGHGALFLCGAVTQFGSAVGAIGMFGLVNYTKIFQPYVPCAQ